MNDGTFVPIIKERNRKGEIEMVHQKNTHNRFLYALALFFVEFTQINRMN